MGREIKFRYLDKNTGLIHYFDENEAIGDEFNRMQFGCGNYELMQYTGLKDTQGNDIYEGDKIFKKIETSKNGINFIGYVKFYECQYWIDNGKESVPLWDELSELKIIGNEMD